jgi:hypothetical protein
MIKFVQWTNAKLLVYVHEGITIVATLMFKGHFNKVFMCNCNTFILVIISLSFTINVTNSTISSFVPWFRMLSQYDASIVLLLGFGKGMQYPSKF